MNDKQTTDELNMTGLRTDISCGHGAAKFREIHEIPRNSQKHANTAKFSGNLVKYMSVQRF